MRGDHSLQVPKSKVIYMCENQHHFINNDVCPYCNHKYIRKYEYMLGDCIKCGNFCPGYAYGCTKPEPLEQSE
jgi:ribosomal protein L37AE/L43A